MRSKWYEIISFQKTSKTFNIADAIFDWNSITEDTFHIAHPRMHNFVDSLFLSSCRRNMAGFMKYFGAFVKVHGTFWSDSYFTSNEIFVLPHLHYFLMKKKLVWSDEICKVILGYFILFATPKRKIYWYWAIQVAV